MNSSGDLNIKDFDPKGCERVSKREEYIKAVSETVEKGKKEALKWIKVILKQ